MENNFFQRLCGIPLFQGISRDDFIGIAAKTHFDFRTYHAGETIVAADEACTHLVCTIIGAISRETRSDDGRYLLRELSDKPTVIQPERLFGRRQRYSATFVATKETSVLFVPKHEVRDILFAFEAFHINYLNFVCSAKQVWEARLWQPFPEDVEDRFIHFITTRATRPAGRKELHIGMIDLAAELVTTRLNVSRMLNTLKDDNLIYLKRGHIIIPELEKLILRQQNHLPLSPVNAQ